MRILPSFMYPPTQDHVKNCCQMLLLHDTSDYTYDFYIASKAFLKVLCVTMHKSYMKVLHAVYFDT